MKKLKFLYVLFFTHILFVLFAFSSYSNVDDFTADQATREVDRSVREEVEERLQPKTPQTENLKDFVEGKQKDDTSIKFYVNKIELVGTKSLPYEKFASLLRPYEERNVSFEDIKMLTKRVEKVYLKNGIIATCFIPPQDMKRGTIVMQVVEAKMGKLYVNEGSFFCKKRIYYYWDIKPGDVLRYDKMSKSIQFMNVNPDRDVTASLSAGNKPGTTNVTLNAKTQFPLHIFYSFDQEGAVSTGRERKGIGIRHNNFLFLDDTLTLGYMFGAYFSSKYVYHSIPISNFGTSIMYGYSDSKSTPKKRYTSMGINSRVQNTSVYLYQDLYKKAEYFGQFSLGFDANDKVVRWTGGTISRDRFRVLRSSLTLIQKFPGAIATITPQISQGLNMFGARGRNILSSRQGGAGNTFTKGNLTARYRKILPFKLDGTIKFTGQITGEKLASQEQLPLGGINSIRGYPSQDYMADNGFFTNTELSFPCFLFPEDLKLPYAQKTLRENVKGIVFFDYGYGEKRGAINAEEIDEVHYASYGTGLRIRLYNQMLLKLEWGFPFGDRSILESPTPRFHFSLNFEDKFGEEFERIRKIIKENNITKIANRLLDKELLIKGSPLRVLIYDYLSLANLAYNEGDLEDARRNYAKIIRSQKTLLPQAKNYIKNCITREKNLKKLHKLALKHYNSGNLEEAKLLWKRIIQESEIKPLVLSLQ